MVQAVVAGVAAATAPAGVTVSLAVRLADTGNRLGRWNTRRTGTRRRVAAAVAAADAAGMAAGDFVVVDGAAVVVLYRDRKIAAAAAAVHNRRVWNSRASHKSQ
jgi:hypothetical protein